MLTAQQAVRREADRAAERHHVEARQSSGHAPSAPSAAAAGHASYPAVSYMGSMGVGSNNALAAAASQAIAATQHVSGTRGVWVVTGNPDVIDLCLGFHTSSSYGYLYGRQEN